MNQPRLLERVRNSIRSLHYSLRTEQAYIFWVRRFILFHRKRHPETMGEPEISEFLTHLVVARQVSASTQNQALSAILFLYKRVLNRELDHLGDIIRAKRPKHLPVVLSRTRYTVCFPPCQALMAWLRGFSMGPACVRWSVCGCASSMLIFHTGRYACAPARVTKTG